MSLAPAPAIQVDTEPLYLIFVDGEPLKRFITEGEMDKEVELAQRFTPMADIQFVPVAAAACANEMLMALKRRRDFEFNKRWANATPQERQEQQMAMVWAEYQAVEHAEGRL